MNSKFITSCHAFKGFILIVVTSTTNMASLVHKESLCSLISRVQSIMGLVMNPKQDRLNMEVMGFAKTLSHLFF